MNESEAAELLTVCSTYDDREVTRERSTAWALALPDIAFTDAAQAVVAHYSKTRERIMPADVRTGVRAIRNLRIARHEEPPPDADPDDTKAHLEALRANRLMLAEADIKPDPAGQAKVRAMIESGAPPKPPRADYGLAAPRARALAAAVARERIANADKDDPELAARVRQARAEARAELDSRRTEPSDA